jgi:hypothetical protein
VAHRLADLDDVTDADPFGSADLDAERVRQALATLSAGRRRRISALLRRQAADAGDRRDAGLSWVWTCIADLVDGVEPWETERRRRGAAWIGARTRETRQNRTDGRT